MPKTVLDVLAQNGIEDDSLSHYGIPGMRWGKRRSRAQLDSNGEKPKTVKDMTDDELKARISRLKLEQEYAKLTAPQVSAGRKVVTNLLADIGKQQAKNYLNKEITKMIDDLSDRPKKPKPIAGQLALGR